MLIDKQVFGGQADRRTGGQADRRTGGQADRGNSRNSSIELLKIIAIFLIVISHVTQTLGYPSTSVDFQDYVYPIENATTDKNAIILTMFYQFGALGNNIFFICSAWFLVNAKKTARKKGFLLLCTVWTISVIVLMIYFGLGQHNISLKGIAKCLFPTTFSTNWFLTCYIIFLFIYPYLNSVIVHVNQKEHLRIVLFSSFLWIVAGYFYETLFFASRVILWVTIYFLVAYLKLYCKRATSRRKVGLILILIGASGFIGQVLVANYLGLYISVLKDKVLRWNSNCNPFYIMLALGSFIIALQSNLRNKYINYISSLSLFIYLFHENYLFREYTRPYIWQLIYTILGYEHVILLDLGFAVVLFLVSVIISAVYKETIQHFINRIVDKLYAIVSRIYFKVERLLIPSVEELI